MSPRRVLTFFAVIIVVLVFPLGVAAHSELKTPSPADNATLAAQPEEILLTFTEELDAKSSVTLHDPSGAQIAKAGVDATDNTAMRIPLSSLTLAPGTYEIRWTSVATDGDILHGILHFTLTAPSPTPTVAPTASAAPSETAAPSASPSLIASPSPSPSGGGTTTTSTSDLVIPIVAALILIALFGAWLVRSRSRGRAA
jgi:methionine-rich copper-binding protein CopC